MYAHMRRHNAARLFDNHPLCGIAHGASFQRFGDGVLVAFGAGLGLGVAVGCGGGLVCPPPEPDGVAVGAAPPPLPLLPPLPPPGVAVSVAVGDPPGVALPGVICCTAGEGAALAAATQLSG